MLQPTVGEHTEQQADGHDVTAAIFADSERQGEPSRS
jgi:hypothetical protein